MQHTRDLYVANKELKDTLKKFKAESHKTAQLDLCMLKNDHKNSQGGGGGEWWPAPQSFYGHLISWFPGKIMMIW